MEVGGISPIPVLVPSGVLERGGVGLKVGGGTLEGGGGGADELAGGGSELLVLVADSVDVHAQLE